MEVLKNTFANFIENDCPSLAASVAYYAIFSLPPLLAIVISVTGFFVKPEEIRGEVAQQANDVVGEEGAEQVTTMIEHANRSGRGWIGTVVGIGILVFSATGVMVQLQAALNRVFEVAPDPSQGGVKSFLVKRVLSFAMVLVLAFLLLMALVISTLLSSIGDRLTDVIPGMSSTLFPSVINATSALFIALLLFLAMYKWLPDAEVAWQDALLGASLAAVTLVIGNILLNIYFAHASIATSYGAAGSLVLILLWFYYSAMIFLVGAELTQAWAKAHGREPTPERDAVKVIRTTQSEIAEET